MTLSRVTTEQPTLRIQDVTFNENTHPMPAKRSRPDMFVLATLPPQLTPQELARAVEERDTAIERTPTIFRAMLQELLNLSPNHPTPLHQLNQQYAQALTTINNSNLSIARAGGGTQREITERFARLQLNSLATLERELSSVIGTNRNNWRCGLLTDNLGCLQGERSIYTQFLAGGNLPNTNNLLRGLEPIHARIRRDGVINTPRYAEYRQAQGNILGQVRGTNVLNVLLSKNNFGGQPSK